jgi:hypothetical protein
MKEKNNPAEVAAPTEERQTFLALCQHYMAEHGLDRVALAEKLGISDAAVWKWSVKGRPPRRTVILDLIDVFRLEGAARLDLIEAWLAIPAPTRTSSGRTA